MCFQRNTTRVNFNKNWVNILFRILTTCFIGERVYVCVCNRDGGVSVWVYVSMWVFPTKTTRYSTSSYGEVEYRSQEKQLL